uniref:F-actin monooxygenase n=1 Tax=Echeneis naucrates TaxID=173247 RepID=A0A665W8Q0_ECHNA
MGDGSTAATGGDGVNRSHVLFDNFVQATTCKGTLKAFQELCDHLEVKPTEHKVFYHKLKSKLNYWKAKALWAKLDKRASHKEYKKGRACANSKCLIIGAGPCGLRTAIELAFLGAKVVLLEKRDAFSRNNVLHLWPFTIQDLRGLGAKKFYGKFCAGAIDHISIRQLQLMLLKVALLLGIEIHVNVEFKGLIEPPEDQETERIGWRAEVHPRTHPASELEFDVIIGADGRRNTLPGFRRKEFRGKLAIAITANFINRNTTAEAKVEEISGVAFIFNQKFFQDLREATGIDLENIVYYKDDTHYFVMTAKKQSLLEKGVILHDYADTELLLSRANVDQAALLSYAREAADFSTSHQLPTLDFAINHYGQPDVAMFDFTCMYASENAAMVRQRNGHKLLVALVGDSLLEPFWPMGTGIARGFLAAMDSGWMVKSWAQGKTPLEVLAERESIYRLLPQTTPENVSKNFSQYSVDPTTRYPNISLNFLKPSQVRSSLWRSGLWGICSESVARSSKLLNWCQRQTEGYRNVNVTDLTMSWKSGLALCALIHRYRPDLIDFDSLDERDQEKNNQLGFDVAEKEFGISPCMTGKEMSSVVEPDKLSMVMYLSQFYEMFKDTVPPGGESDRLKKTKILLCLFFPQEEVFRTGRDDRPSVILSDRKMDSAAVGNHNKVKVMATQLLAKFEENAPAQPTGLKRQGSLRKEFPVNIGGSDVCFFCRKRVYVMERLSAEGKFFHRSCFKCDYCGTTLRLSSYAFDVEDELNAKLTRRVQKAARRQAKQEELKRLHRAQIIQRQLEQVEEKQRQLEERGVAVEKALRGEAGMGKKDDPKLMQEWFKLVQEKNALVRYESELMIFARELELEDRQSRLQQELRERMAVEDHLKTEKELAQEKQILNEMLEVVEQRDALVALLEEQRLREKEEDKDLEAVMLSKGFNLNWA